MDEDQELLQDFRTESLEHMTEIEPLFLEIEELEGEAQLEVVNQIFRAAHSVKGAAGFFGLDRIQNLAHIMENLLMRVRDGELVFQSDMTDALLAGVDKLSQLIEALPEVVDLSIDEEIDRLKPLIEGEGASPEAASAEAPAESATVPPAPAVEAEAAEPVPEPQPEPATAVSPESTGESATDDSFPEFVINEEAAEEVARFGQRIYGIVFDDVPLEQKSLVHDTKKRAGSIGKVLSALPAELTGGCLALQIGSVLEIDLVAGALGIDPSRIRLLRERVTMSDDRLAQVTNKKTGKDGAKSQPAAAKESKPAAVAESKAVTPPVAGSKPTETAVAAVVGAVVGAEVSAAPESKPDPPAAGSAGGAGSNSGDSGKPKVASKKMEAAETVRVSVDLLDKLMDLAGELVLGRNQLLARLDQTDDPSIKGVLQNIDIVTSDLQSNIMNTRMQPVGNVFKKYHRVVRDLSRKLGKKVDLVIEGSEVELDKSIIELLSDPLTHLVRNSLDHGIEAPAKRLLVGKSESGLIELHAYHEGGQVNIEIRDDGRGIDPAKTRALAIERGMMTPEEAEALSDSDAVMLIFAAGFSLAAEVTEVSGRGVGMDVVKANITKLGGKIDIDSEVGKGATIRIRLPLTLAIVPSLIVVVDQERFAVPQVNLVEIVRIKASEIPTRLEQIKGADVLRLRGRLLPLVRLADTLEIPRYFEDPETGAKNPDRRKNLAERPVAAATSDAARDADDTSETRRTYENQSAIHVVVLRSGEHRYGLIVDRIADSEEIVVKPLSQFIKGCRCYAGATIMGDGRVAMILDVAGIAADTNLRFHDLAEESDRRERKIDETTGSRRELILFANAASEQFAVDLAQIVRLEKIEANEIERIGGSEYMQHLGKGLPLIRLENEISVNPIEECEEYYVLIPSGDGTSGGILASRVIDTVDIAIELNKSKDDPPCVSGRALVQGRLTTILDAELLLASALGDTP
ncbi:MAG: chemotaxis protein CheW [Myxococcales bacterium]|nr:chemotaxis protein CheW [Myxococcales bacterium]